MLKMWELLYDLFIKEIDDKQFKKDFYFVGDILYIPVSDFVVKVDVKKSNWGDYYDTVCFEVITKNGVIDKIEINLGVIFNSKLINGNIKWQPKEPTKEEILKIREYLSNLIKIYNKI
jgi:hypothetical protein